MFITRLPLIIKNLFLSKLDNHSLEQLGDVIPDDINEYILNGKMKGNLAKYFFRQVLRMQEWYKMVGFEYGIIDSKWKCDEYNAVTTSYQPLPINFITKCYKCEDPVISDCDVNSTNIYGYRINHVDHVTSEYIPYDPYSKNTPLLLCGVCAKLR
jgi:hypothetical protein